VGPGVPREARGTELALGPRGAVAAAEAPAGVGVTQLGGPLRVCVPGAVARHAEAGRFGEAGAAPVTVRTPVWRKALIAPRGATGTCTGTETHMSYKGGHRDLHRDT